MIVNVGNLAGVSYLWRGYHRRYIRHGKYLVLVSRAAGISATTLALSAHLRSETLNSFHSLGKHPTHHIFLGTIGSIRTSNKLGVSALIP
jgi:hypothetical protein